MRGREWGAAFVFPLAIVLAAGDPARAADRYEMSGLVLQVDPSHRSFVVSHDSVPGVMSAMAMPFDVHEPSVLDGVVPGMTVEFTLVVEPAGAYVEHVRVRRYDPAEQDPLAAERLALLKDVLAQAPPAPLVAIGETVPDFTLTDQANRPVTLSALRGKVVAVNFIYTNCALPQFCFRLASHFGVLQRHFGPRMGQDLILLTVTFDPVRDQPERLAEYSKQWNADASNWHFLTGAVPDVRRVCSLFGVQAFRDDGLMNHSSRTAVIDRQGRLVANIEGNQYTTGQLADLVETVTRQP
jgi:protein SCO1/2